MAEVERRRTAFGAAPARLRWIGPVVASTFGEAIKSFNRRQQNGRDGMASIAPAGRVSAWPYRPIAEMRVAQLLSAPRVPPHWNSGGVRYSLRVQVCAMYSVAVQMVLPSAAAAP